MKDTLPLRVRFGAFELDLKAGELYSSGATGDRSENAIILPQQPLRLLLMLIESEGTLVTREHSPHFCSGCLTVTVSPFSRSRLGLRPLGL